ncbi:MAG: helix-turn-helix domain-containing protein [Acidobacteria bacterium]|nr:helix-turn-helix domain-containing protein [Acidobacteriota bacterium]MBU4404768.1 helix-turn-helix domain-containing protein [Acidobacteriota bacterium]MCG2812057.1 helix-turn-helix domain-containing protein [Candidatus Aminicenantes bacterium]
MKRLLHFGSYFEQLRQEQGLTLRMFCKKASCDPANISRMERGLIQPPKGREILEKYAEALNLVEGSDEWYQFFDLAAADQGIVPQDIMEDAELVKVLPVFFRSLRGQKLAEKIRSGMK